MVPLALVPEDGSDIRINTVVTLPVDASAFDTVLLDCQSSAVVGTSPRFEVTLQESPDRVNWSAVAGPDAPTTLATGAIVRSLGSLRRRWLRLRVEWSGVVGVTISQGRPIEIGVDRARQVLRVALPATQFHPAATLWCSGSLERRSA